MPPNPAPAAPVSGVIALDDIHIAVAALLVLLCGVISVVLRLGLERQLLIASVRTVVQLLLIGYLLKWVFGLDSPYPVLTVLTMMIAVASHAAAGRSARTYRGILGDTFVTLALSGLATTFTVTALIIGVKPWYRPQYIIPLLGMVLGNGLTGISLCLDQLLESLAERRAEVEMELAHGATKWEAAVGPLGSAVRRAMIPTINSMMVVGIVALPGMMTGQILSGTDPRTAVRYQIVVMFMIAASSAVGCILVALLAYRRLFTARHQLDASRIQRRSK